MAARSDFQRDHQYGYIAWRYARDARRLTERLRPLCGQDKLETIRIAEKIGTFELSKVQVPDSCTVFAPDNPATRVTVPEAEKEEAKIPGYWEMIEQLAETALSGDKA